MKIRSLLTIVAMLSVLLLGIGTAHAILGVADDVPAKDLVFPFVCVKTPSATNNLNTNWAIADVIGGSPDANGNLVDANCTICTINSVCFPDYIYVWTPFDVVTDNCKDRIATRNINEQNQLTVTNDVLGAALPGGPYFAGYIKCTQQDTPVRTTGTVVTNRFMNNMYLIDTPLGFASGFNGPSNEDGLTPFLGENTTSPQEVTAFDVYLRYFLDNTNANTWDWWILLAGRNQYNSININSTRNLNCQKFCDEEENCVSMAIPIPNELNLINIASFIPGAPLDTTYPRAGFAACNILETGTRNTIGFSGTFTINGTINNPTIAPPTSGTCVPATGAGCTFYSVYGWSYERAQAGTLIGDFDVVHPMFRRYCSASTVATSTTGAFPTGGSPAQANQVNCTCAGTGC